MKKGARRKPSSGQSARPPASTGLSKKSPTTAPSGRVRMNAAQNSAVCESARPEVRRGDHRQQRAEYHRGAGVTQPGRIGRPVAQRGAERLGEHDGHPVEYLGLGELTESTDTVPSVRYQNPRDPISKRNSSVVPPA